MSLVGDDFLDRVFVEEIADRLDAIGLGDHHDICRGIHTLHPQAVSAKSTEKHADVAADINGEIALTEPEAPDHAVGEFGPVGLPGARR